jgi:hypothetical protein
MNYSNFSNYQNYSNKNIFANASANTNSVANNSKAKSKLDIAIREMKDDKKEISTISPNPSSIILNTSNLTNPIKSSNASNCSDKSIQGKKSSQVEYIEKEVEYCIQDIDRKYYNPNFNLIGEIVNIFGDINFDKVKMDIERLTLIDEKLDKVIKLIVDKHSEEFYKILGFVRQMLREIENTKLKLAEARDVLTNTNSIISNLSTGENSDWKLKSIYCSEIISKLNKTHYVLRIIQDCEDYMENQKILDAISLLRKSRELYSNYDKEFRNCNFLVPINNRFIKLREKIQEKIFSKLNSILFFSDERVLERKISSLFVYFLNFYNKISIDTELTRPMEKFMFIISETVNKTLSRQNFEYEFESVGAENYSNANSTQYMNYTNSNIKENLMDLESESKISSLIYLLKCLRNYDQSTKILYKLSESYNENLNTFIDKTLKIIVDTMKIVDFAKYDLEGKSDKIKFLLFFQIFLMLISHNFTKILAIGNYSKERDQREIIEQKIIPLIENIILLPMQVYTKIAQPKQNSDSQSTEHNEYILGESLVRMKINEILTNNTDNLPILYKIFHKFYEFTYKLSNVKLTNLSTQLMNYNNQLFSFYSKKIIPKKFFDLASFMTDYDGDISNFKFINEFIFKINRLKELLLFAFDSGYFELTKIIKIMLAKFYEEMKTFIENIKSKCVYNLIFQSFFEELTKTKDFREISVKLEFKKFEKKIIDIEDKSNFDFRNMLSGFIYTQSIKGEEAVLITRNYKLMELLTKFVYCVENLIQIAENFVFDLMKCEMSHAKITAIVEQIHTLYFVDFNKETKDLATLIMYTLKILEKISIESSKIILICKVEFSCLLINLFKKIIKNDYWLHEPQMTPEYFVTSFVNDYNMFKSLFQYNLNEAEYNFISKDFIFLLNNGFLNCLQNLTANSINNFGVNLLIRDFEFIKEKIGSESNLDSVFVKSIFYFPNYIRLLNCTQENLSEELRKFYSIKPFEEEFVEPLMTIRTNSRQSLNQFAKSQIIKDIFK